MGDRFGHQATAQLQAVVQAAKRGVAVVPVWNKSHREHSTIVTKPDDVRAEADAAVRALGWTGSYYVDADHIGMSNVQEFLRGSNFFTIDVADFIGKPAAPDALDRFVDRHKKYARGGLVVPGLELNSNITVDMLRAIGAEYLLAVSEAGRIYRYIESVKGRDQFVTEVSMDETDVPQTPVALFFILAALAHEGVPVQTIAPKFSGRFNKGVDYVGDVEQFRVEFEGDLAVIEYAVEPNDLPSKLKLSDHSGSDKFAIYGPIRDAIQKHHAGLHVKTAGTTWLEEVIGLASAGGEGLVIAKDIYRQAYAHRDALTKPYATVIDIRPEQLPDPHVLEQWSGEQFVAALRHDSDCPQYNPDIRQLIHVGYKVAAQMGTRYRDALKQYQEVIAHHVTGNLLDRHIVNIFPPDETPVAPAELARPGRAKQGDSATITGVRP